MHHDSGLWLASTVDKVHGVAGTVHVVEGDGLRLLAAVNIPPAVKEAVDYLKNTEKLAPQKVAPKKKGT